MSDDRVNPKMRRWQFLIWSDSGPPGPAKRALLQVLFDFLVSSPESRVFPSIATLAVKTDQTEKTVGRHLAELQTDGWFRRDSRPGSGQAWRRFEYHLTFPRHFDASKDEWLKSVDEKQKEKRAGSQSKGMRFDEFMAADTAKKAAKDEAEEYRQHRDPWDEQSRR